MHVNAHKGEATVELDGKAHVLRFDWEGFAILREQLGDTFEVETAQALARFDLKYIARVLAVGLRESCPGITPEDIVKAAPPIGPVADAISLAYRRAWWGASGKPPEEPRQNPLKRLLGTIGRRMSFSAG